MTIRIIQLFYLLTWWKVMDSHIISRIGAVHIAVKFCGEGVDRCEPKLVSHVGDRLG